MMLSPPFQDHIPVFLEPGGPKAGAHVTKTCFPTGSPSQMILAEGRQAWREGCLIPCLFYQHKVSVSFKEYPLLQEAILVTLAHYNLPSNFLGHWLSGCTTSPHLTVTAIPGTHLSSPIAVPCFCCFPHNAHPTTL